jgi:hypothetical protein
MEAEEYRDRIASAMLRGNSRAHTVDVSGYPADVSEAIEVVCELWYLVPPATKKSKAYWIASARELNDACGEYGLEAIRRYRRKFEEDMQEIKRKTGQGCAPHTVEGPGSLVKMVRDTARRMREEAHGGELDRNRYATPDD